MNQFQSKDRQADRQMGDDLQGLFAPHRAASDKFRDGVQARIAELEEAAAAKREVEPGADAEADATGKPDSGLRRVASFMPLDPSGMSMAGSSLLKFSYSALALPALVMAAVLGAFISSYRSIFRITETAAPVPRGPKHNFRIHLSPLNPDLRRASIIITAVQCTTLLTLLIGFLGGGSLAVDILTLALLAAMAGLVLAIRGLASANILSRHHVAGLTLGMLMTVFMGCFVWWGSFSFAEGSSALGVRWSAGVVLFGAIACCATGFGLRFGALATIFALGLIVFINPLAGTKSSVPETSSQLENIWLDPTELDHWRSAAAMFEALKSIDTETPSLESVAKTLALAIESKVDIHPVVLTAAARMGLIDVAHWNLLAKDELTTYQLDNLLIADRRVSPTDYDEYLIPMLLATRELTAAERSVLIANIEACWSESNEHGALGTTAMCAHCLDLLGVPGFVQAHREDVHMLLRSHWIQSGGLMPFAKIGGFTADPDKFHTSFPGDTWNAIELMSRFGVPPEIDLVRVRDFLRSESRAYPFLIGRGFSYLKALQRASLLRLREELKLPARSWFGVILSERLLIASVLLVLLCLVSIRLAPTFPEGEGGGAQP